MPTQTKISGHNDWFSVTPSSVIDYTNHTLKPLIDHALKKIGFSDPNVDDIRPSHLYWDYGSANFYIAGRCRNGVDVDLGQRSGAVQLYDGRFKFHITHEELGMSQRAVRHVLDAMNEHTDRNNRRRNTNILHA